MLPESCFMLAFLFGTTLGDIDDPARLKTAINTEAAQFKLDKSYIEAMVFQESGGGVCASRWEKGFFLRYIDGKPKDRLGGHFPPERSLNTELYYRAGSWGPMQVMGQTARELGFRGTDFVELAKPEIGVHWGCRYLRSLLNKFEGMALEQAYREAIARYNGGPANPNYQYADEVLNAKKTGQSQQIYAKRGKRS